jgi:hypothetical protein
MGRTASVPPMVPKVFWDIINASNRPSDEARLDALEQMLITLPVEDIIGFNARLWRCFGEANRLDLWVAMDLLSGGNTEEDFTAFCSWVISRSCAVFANALADPDSLGELSSSDRYELEPLRLIAWSAWAEKTSNPMENYPYESEEHFPWPQRAGSDWDIEDEDELKRRFPRLMGRLQEP